MPKKKNKQNDKETIPSVPAQAASNALALTPKHVRAFQELLESEERFAAEMQKLADSAPHFKQLLGAKASELKTFINRANELCQQGFPLFALLGTPRLTPAQAITEENFSDKISELYDIIYNKQLFREHFIPHLALMGVRLKRNTELIAKIKLTLSETEASPAYFNQKVKEYFSSGTPSQFLPSCNIKPVQRQAHYPLLLGNILEATPATEATAREQLQTLVMVTTDLLRKTNDFDAKSHDSLRSPAVKREIANALANNGSAPKSKRSRLPPSAPDAEEKTLLIKADTLELIANIMRLNDYYTDFSRNSKQRWKKQSKKLATLGAKSYLQITQKELNEQELLKIRNDLLTEMKKVQESIQKRWFYGSNSRLAKTLLELQKYYSISPEMKQTFCNEAKNIPNEVLFFADAQKEELNQRILTARGCIKRHIIARTASSFIKYTVQIKAGFWRKRFTSKDKIGASTSLVDKLTTMQKETLSKVNEDESIGVTLRKTITPSDISGNSPFFKGKFGKAQIKAENYLNAITSTQRPEQRPGKGLQYG